MHPAFRGRARVWTPTSAAARAVAGVADEMVTMDPPPAARIGAMTA